MKTTTCLALCIGQRAFALLAFSGLIALLLTACGGGGGSATPEASVQPSQPLPAFTVTCGNGALAVSTVSATDTSVCPVTNTPTATVTVTTGSITQTSTTPIAPQSPTVTFAYGSLSIAGHRDTTEFKPCYLNNVQNSILVYSCRTGDSTYYMSFSFASDAQGKVQLSWAKGANYSLYNNYYGNQFPTNNRTLRQITFNNVSLDLAGSFGSVAGLPVGIVVNGTLGY